MADLNQGECRKTFHNWGWATRATNPIYIKGKWIVPEDEGKPDIMVQSGMCGAHIEIKQGDTSFAFDQWRENQRTWAKSNGSKHNLWFWLGLGVNPPNYDPEKYCPRAAFLFPYWAMLLCEQRLEPYQKSLPYRKKGSLIAIQEKGLYAEHLLKNYRLTWDAGGWTLPKEHPFPMQPLPDYIRLLETLGESDESNIIRPATVNPEPTGITA